MTENQSRINEIAHLKDGWLDGEGYGVDTKACLAFYERFKHLFAGFCIYPTLEGGLSFERSTEDYGISFEIAPGFKTGLYDEVGYCGASDLSMTIDFTSEESVKVYQDYINVT